MPEKKYRYISFLVTPELASALKSASIARERSASWIIKKSLEKYLKLKVTKPKPRK
jgi:hypothetical protein